MKTVELYYCDNCGKWNGSTETCSACSRICTKRTVPAKRGGLYYVPGVDKPLYSVTGVIQVLAKPGLTYWLKQKVAEAVFADPTISMAEAITAPDKVANVAASKGQDIHRIVEGYAKGETIDLESFQDPWKNHVQAFLSFVKEVPHKILKAEHIVYSKTHQFAGQLDAIAEIGGVTYLLDYKTNKSLYPKDHAIQLGAYKLAAEEMGIKIDKCAIVHLKADGTFAFVEIKPEPKIFLACLYLHNYQLT